MLEAVEDRTVDTLHSYNGPGGIAIGLEALRGLGWTTSGLRLAHGYGLTPMARHTLTHAGTSPRCTRPRASGQASLVGSTLAVCTLASW
jgi:hypothetical protein